MVQKNDDFIYVKLSFIQEGGFFVECGALSGERISNSLFFEKTRHWSGLLIEADPMNYAILKTKNRKAFTINACLSVYPYPVKVRFHKLNQFYSGDPKRVIADPDQNAVSDQCFHCLQKGKPVFSRNI